MKENCTIKVKDVLKDEVRISGISMINALTGTKKKLSWLTARNLEKIVLYAVAELSKLQSLFVRIMKDV